MAAATRARQHPYPGRKERRRNTVSDHLDQAGRTLEAALKELETFAELQDTARRELDDTQQELQKVQASEAQLASEAADLRKTVSCQPRWHWCYEIWPESKSLLEYSPLALMCLL